MPDIATDSAFAAGVEAQSFRAALPMKAYEEAGIGPEVVRDVGEDLRPRHRPSRRHDPLHHFVSVNAVHRPSG